MMQFTWEDVDQELDRLRTAWKTGNAGKARTAARRTVGMAIALWLQKHPRPEYGSSFMNFVETLSWDESAPQNVRGAAERLGGKISERGKTAFSIDPMEDAETILDWIRKEISKYHEPG